MKKDQKRFHTLDIEYNGQGPFTAVSEFRTGFSLTLGTHTGMDFFTFSVNIAIDKNTTKHYRLRSVLPGDRFRITYDGPNVDTGTTINHIESLDRIEPEFRILEGMRLGFDIIEGEERIRLSHPKGGGMSLMLSNVPLDHARVAVSAGNDDESWSWQQKDLYAGDSLEIVIVSTDWTDAYPCIERIVRVDT